VYKSAILNDVLKAITVNVNQLLWTGLLALVILYLYAVVGMLLLRGHYFVGDFPNERFCDNLVQCYFNTIREGLINGGGMTDYLLYGEGKHIHDSPNYFGRFAFDVSFFIIVLVILLNVIFGIIIDTFAALREETASIQANMSNVCFICDIERSIFDRAGQSFAVHIKTDHNMWMYLRYFVYLIVKDEADYNGVESYINVMLNSDDLGFFPVNQAMCFVVEETVDEVQVTGQKFQQHINEMKELLRAIQDLKSQNSSSTVVSSKQRNSALLQLKNLIAMPVPPNF